MSVIMEPLSYGVLGLAMKVHTELGPGIDERFYHDRLADRLRGADVKTLIRPRMNLWQSGVIADRLEADLVVGDQLLAELKALRAGGLHAGHLTQTLCYLKAWKLRAGLLIDFGRERLMWRRVLRPDDRPVAFDPDRALEDAARCGADLEVCRSILASANSVLNQHGLGYTDLLYRRLLCTEFRVRRIGFIEDPRVELRVSERSLGVTELHCVQLASGAVVMVVALQDGIPPASVAILRSYLRHLQAPWGMIAHFGKRALQLLPVGPMASWSAGSGEMAGEPHECDP